MSITVNVLRLIFEHLNCYDLRTIMTVNRDFYAICKSIIVVRKVKYDKLITDILGVIDNTSRAVKLYSDCDRYYNIIITYYSRISRSDDSYILSEYMNKKVFSLQYLYNDRLYNLKPSCTMIIKYSEIGKVLLNLFKHGYINGRTNL